MGQAEKNRQNKTAKIGLPGENFQNRLPAHGCLEKTARAVRTRQPERDSQDKQAEQDRQNRTVSSGLPGQYR
jgi:hypothetical protein